MNLQKEQTIISEFLRVHFRVSRGDESKLVLIVAPSVCSYRIDVMSVPSGKVLRQRNRIF